MKKKPYRKFTAIAVFLLCLSGLLTSYYHYGGYSRVLPVYPWTTQQVRNILQSEVPVGSSVSQVQVWLHTMNIDYDYSTVATDPPGTAETEPYKYAPKPFSSYLTAVMRQNDNGLIYSEHIFIYFYFDKQGKLINYYVDVDYDNP